RAKNKGKRSLSLYTHLSASLHRRKQQSRQSCHEQFSELQALSPTLSPPLALFSISRRNFAAVGIFAAILTAASTTASSFHPFLSGPGFRAVNLFFWPKYAQCHPDQIVHNDTQAKQLSSPNAAPIIPFEPF